MATYLKKLSQKATFTQKGLKGYMFPLVDKELETYFVDVKNGHDTYIISKKCTHIYYVLKGSGFFILNKKKVSVKVGALIEVPPKIEYTYSGKMQLLLIMTPPWFQGNETSTRKNPAVK